MSNSGAFVISLDFEKAWGMHDVNVDGHYDEHLRNVDVVVPRMLQLFEQYEIHATWATVGLLFGNNYDELQPYIPVNRPTYKQKEFCSYKIVEQLSQLANDELYYGKCLVEAIRATPFQEIGTHTFSHYYCLEDGQTKQQFSEDLAAAIAINQQPMYSIVFPRNQVNKEYLAVCEQQGIMSYRGVEQHKMYQTMCFSQKESLRSYKVLRLLDAYLNISGFNTYKWQQLEQQHIINIPASRFLRPYHQALKVFESFRLKRIKKAMTYAAQHGEIYHLWWHPHNMGAQLDHNFSFLVAILQHFQYLQQTYNMQSMSMYEVTQAVRKGE